MAFFFCKTGDVATFPHEHRRTVNSGWYTTICLPNFFGKIRKTNKRSWIIVRHDIAVCHTSAQNSACLTGQNVEPEDTVGALEVSQSEWKNKHKWWSYIKTFWLPLCKKMSNFSMEITDFTRNFVVTYVYIIISMAMNTIDEQHLWRGFKLILAYDNIISTGWSWKI